MAFRNQKVSSRKKAMWPCWTYLLLISIASFKLKVATVDGRVLSSSQVDFTATDVPLYPHQVPCPTDDSLMGYTSIKDINLDIQRATNLVTSQSHVPPEKYVYTICPNTILNGESQLSPVLHNSHFICGRYGHSSDNCHIKHGMTQVLIIDTDVQPYPRPEAKNEKSDFDPTRRLFVFRGLTFSNSKDVSVAAVASSTTFAEFYDCHWKKGFQQQVGILIALGQVVSTPFAIPDMVYQLVDNVNYYAMEGNGISNDEEGSDGLDDEHNLFKNNVKPVSGDAFESISSWRADSTKLGENKYIESQHIPMAVYLVNSTFTDGDEQESEGFLQEHIYMPEPDEEYNMKQLVYRPIFNSGHLHMSNVTFRGHSSRSTSTSSSTVGSSKTRYAVNIVEGTASIEDCTFADNHVEAVIRPIQSSQVTVRRSIFARNDASGIIVTVGQSNVTLDQSYFEDNAVRTGQVVVLDDSRASIQDSCFTVYEDRVSTATTVVVDASSHLDHHSGNFAGKIVQEDIFLTGSHAASLRSGGGRSGSGASWHEEVMSSTVTAASLTNNGLCPPAEGEIFLETGNQNCFSESEQNSIGVGSGCEGSCVAFDSATCPLPALWAQANENDMATQTANLRKTSSSPSLSAVQNGALLVSFSLFFTATAFLM